MKKVLILAIFLILGYFIYQFATQKPEQSVEGADVVLFWGNGCPHCEVVKKYIQDNQLDSKLKIVQKEVYFNKANQQLMADYAKRCNLDTQQGLGVPFAYINNTCQVGDTPIIEAIQKLLSQK